MAIIISKLRETNSSDTKQVGHILALRTVHDAAEAGIQNRARTHRTRLNRTVDSASAEITAHFFAGDCDGVYFRMLCNIMHTLLAVLSCCQYHAITDNDGAKWYVTSLF